MLAESDDKSVRMVYVLGYLSTLLIGSMQFGTLIEHNTGYAMTIYGSSLEVFKIMYGWDDNQSGTPSLTDPA